MDQVSAKELLLFIENDGDLYRQQYQPIIKNLAQKKFRGIYDHAKAVKLFMYLAENGAKKYCREVCGRGTVWHQIFGVPERKWVSEQLAKDFETEFSLGNYDHYKQKYLQKKQ
jgi:hypothetical protein